MRARLTLRARATILGTALGATLLVLGSVGLVSTLEDRLTQASDQLSRSRVEDLLTLAASGDLPPVLSSVGDNGVAQVVGARGEVLAASPNIEGAPAIAGPQTGQRLRARTFAAPDDGETETYRFWSAAGPGPAGGDASVTVYVGDSLESVSEASAALRRALWWGVPAAIALLGALLWWLLGRALGRLDRIRAEVDRISEESLHVRVAGDGVDDEVGRLAATMNAMLGRLDESARRQRDLVADVSHDLQSPLASQRVALELALARPDDVDVTLLSRGVLEATAEMERLVADLLVLASIDARVRPVRALLDLDTIVLEEAARARAGGGIEVDASGVSAAPVHANPEDVRRLVRNLVDNAVAHARSRVSLEVALSTSPGPTGEQARLLVVDDGPGIPPELRDRVFDRFFRGVSARSHDGGSGLGLAIARGLAERNGGTLDLVAPPETGSGAGTTMRVLLPTGVSAGGGG